MQFKKTWLTLVSLLSFCISANAHQSDSLLINALVKDIAAAQVATDGEFYAGMFPSFRECGGAPHNYQPDNNIFFTAIGAFALRNMLPYLIGENKKVAQNIISKATSTYPYYKDQFGEPFYNFWPTHAPIMPHTYYFKYLKSVFGQGEDADDTVMILMTDNNDDNANTNVKKRLIDVANKSNGRKIISTYRKYKDIPAYSTYLGTRMTPDFDFAVQCNILYFMYDKHLTFTVQDSATLDLITQMVKNREHMKAPVYLSPYYVKSSILLYHLTRLMGAFHIPELEIYKPQLVEDIHALLDKSTNVMDQIILRTALLRLGKPAPSLDLQSITEFEKSNQQQYIFFQARAAFSYPTPFKQIFLHWSYITYYFYCPAYNKILWLEYLVEKNKKL
ncbi:hypothetical protein FRZ67_20815 [Panacibacter ginsenosidivorans]|uniref:DUF3131 domain-containing protein n=1 Tax=Panacibacter ginsenosidivorans TaxID=1813871 RepID=A0A5B8VDS5_9BACT|nr:hypothetical protein [Panacibacter ginsenosidivorans]QEC69624.1 hypothetical protein FRZ67_20815 [Panacibacter ginsenosidivorans]